MQSQLPKLRTRLVLYTIVFLAFGSDALAWDPVRAATGKNLTNLLKDKARKTSTAAGKILKDPVGSAFNLPKSVLADVCSAPVQYYENTLAGQANGRWRELPPELVRGIQEYYVNDLSRVRYSEGIGTSNGESQTFGNVIYFTRNIDFWNGGDMWLLLHELEHTSQYSGSTQATKLCEYMGKTVGSGFQHDKIDWEQAADRKADYVIDAAMQAMYLTSIGANEVLIQNDTNTDVWFVLEAPNTYRTEIQLQAFTAEIYTFDKSARWVNIHIATGDETIEDSADCGSIVRIYVNKRGVFDFYQEK